MLRRLPWLLTLLLVALTAAQAQPQVVTRPPLPVWPAWLAVHRALRLPGELLVEGRVERGTPPPPLPPDAPPQQRLLTTLRLLLGQGLPNVAVAIELLDGRYPSPSWLVRSDDGGYFQLRVALPAEQPAGLLRLSLRAPDHVATAHTTAVEQIAAGPGLAVVSDIDDTLIDSRVSDRARLLATTLWAQVERQRPFSGAAALLHQLTARQSTRPTPLFYLSGTPQPLGDRLERLLHRHGFPPGSLLLKRLARDPLTDQLAYKFPRLLGLVDSLPERRFILIGDSGEQDPEVYRRLAEQRPGRVAAILIHRVTGEPATAARFAGQLLFDDYATAAAHLRSSGLLGTR